MPSNVHLGSFRVKRAMRSVAHELFSPTKKDEIVLYVGTGPCLPPHVRAIAKYRRVTVLEAFAPFCDALLNSDDYGHVYQEVIHGDVRDSSLIAGRRFDYAMWWHGPEHIYLMELSKVLQSLERSAQQFVLTGCPWGISKQGLVDDNENQIHRQPMYPSYFHKRGYHTWTCGEENNKSDLVARKDLTTRRFVIFGTGHCGTKWLAGVLSQIPSVQCHHELKQRVYHKLWRKCVQGSFDDPEVFWQRYKDAFLKDGVAAVGDSDAYSYRFAELFWNRESFRCAQLVRNGISTVQSLFLNWTSKSWTIADKVWLRSFVGSKLLKLTSVSNMFELVCHWWAAEMRKAREFHSVNCLGEESRYMMLRLEDVGQDPYALWTLAHFLTNCGYTSKQLNKFAVSADQHRHVRQQHDRDPSAIWTRWTGSSRESFRRICGRAMEFFGYRMP